MDVTSVTSTSGMEGARPRPTSGDGKRTGAAGGNAKGERPFVVSTEAVRARQLLERLITGPEMRVDLVEEFRALLEAGHLDTPEAAARAAEGLLGRGDG